MANIPTNQHKYLVYKKQINMSSACRGTKQHNVAWPGLGEVERVGPMEEREQESHKTSYSFDHVWTSNRVFPTTPGRLI